MVVVHVKAAPTTEAEQEEAEQLQFLYECRCDSSIDDVADAVVEIHNLQSTIHRLCRLLRQHLFSSSSSFRESCPDTALALERTLSEAETYASKDQVAHQRFLSPHSLGLHIESIRKQVNVAQLSYPELSLPQLFSDCQLQDGMQLWWAGKELLQGKKLSDYIGSNDKTKIVIKLKPSHSVPIESM